jgi:glycogen debranching enzyme
MSESMEIERIRARLQEDLKGLRSPEGFLYAGSPRYRRLFGRDSLISAWQMLEIDPSIARAALISLAGLQGSQTNPTREEEPGKILHEHRTDPLSRQELPHWDFPYFGSVDSTPLFLVLAGFYVRRTNDETLIRELWPHLKAAYAWVAAGQDAGAGYLRYERKNLFGLFHQGWKDGSEDHLRIRPPVAIVEAQGYAYAAYREFGSIAKRRGEPQLAREAEVRSKSLQARFDEDFRLPSGEFALGLDGSGVARAVGTSNPGHLLFTGILRPGRVAPTVARLFESDLWTPFGIRTHSEAAPDFDPYSYHMGSVWPHDNWIIAEGLRQVGRKREANRIREALIDAYRELGKIPELYAVVDDEIVDLSESPKGPVRANPLQAWASAGLLALLTP